MSDDDMIRFAGEILAGDRRWAMRLAADWHEDPAVAYTEVGGLEVDELQRLVVGLCGVLWAMAGRCSLDTGEPAAALLAEAGRVLREDGEGLRPRDRAVPPDR